MNNNACHYLADLSVLAILLLTPTKVDAQEAYTDPVGFIKLTVVGTNGVSTGPASTFLGLALTQIPTHRGLITASSGLQITLNSPLSSGAFNRIGNGIYTNPVAFIEITSGPGAGVFDDIVSNDTVSVFTASDLSSIATPGTTFKIYPHWTLGSVFGTNNTAGIGGGTSSGNADNINVWNPDTQSYATYFYKTNTAGGGVGWRSTLSASANAANTALYIDQGIVHTRRVGSSTNVMLVGGVKLGRTLTPVVQSGSTFPANVYAASIPLSKSGLYTTNSTTGVGGGTSSGNSDNVNIWNPTTQSYSTYYYKTNSAGGGIGWRSTLSASADASTNQIPLGASVVILRRLVSPFNWTVPQQPEVINP